MKITVLASGRGTGLQSIIDHIKLGILRGVQVSLLITPQGSEASKRAETENIKIHFPKDENDMIHAVQKSGSELVVLAGWMKILGPNFIRSFDGKIINIHPSLLPKFGGKGMYGMHVHEAVVQSGERVSGCTVHFVNEGVDTGAIIISEKVDVTGDSQKLANDVLKVEHKTYPKAIQLIADKRVLLEDGIVSIDYSGEWKEKWDQRQATYEEVCI